MRCNASTPLAAVGRGVFAGVIGTGLMTAWQTLAPTLQGSEETPPQPDHPVDAWEQAPAPAQLAKRIGEGVLRRDVSPELIPLLSNAMHWGYGTGWGVAYAISTAGRRNSTGRRGIGFGALVWAMSYVQLVPLGLYRPPWEYEAQELALDLSYHLAYGLGVAAALRTLSR